MIRKQSIAILAVFIIGLPLLLHASLLKQFEKDVVQVVEKVKPTVVTVSAKFDLNVPAEKGTFLNRQNDQKSQTYEVINIGTGIVLDSTHILTKSSVVLGGSDISIKLVDDKKLTGQLIGTDSELGLAIIEISDTLLAPITLGNSKEVKAGCMTILVGNSFDRTHSMSLGTVNHICSDGLLHLSTNVTSGNAGGPVFDVDGNLVGLLASPMNPVDHHKMVNSPMLQQETIYAYPINNIMQKYRQILSNSASVNGWIGVTADDWPGMMGGVHLRQVTASSPAAQADLKMGDIILAYNSKKINHAYELAEAISKVKPGEEISFRVLRGNNLYTKNLIVGKEPNNSVTAPTTLKNIQNITQTIQQNKTSTAQTSEKAEILFKIKMMEKELQRLHQMVNE